MGSSSDSWHSPSRWENIVGNDRHPAVPIFNDDPRYLDWIKKHVGDIRWEDITVDGHVVGKCMEGETGWASDGEPLCQRCDLVAPMMAKAFPELRPVWGHFMHPIATVGEYMYHHWLVDAEGRIVDPTGVQFDDHCIGMHRTGVYRQAE